MTAIGAVAVVVPARDEEASIEACLTSVRSALAQLPPSIVSAVTVVLDRCVDSTPRRVEELFADWPGAAALRIVAKGGRVAAATPRPAGVAYVVAGSGVGAVRDLGVRDVLDRLRPLPPRAVWLLHTDADTTVPPEWAVAHLDLASAGAAGVLGTVELAAGLSPAAARRYGRLVRSRTDAEGRHHHAYGANLGVRGDAYLAVGGFAVDGPGEDRGLWQALVAAEYPVLHPTGLRVRTSSRTAGRAHGGLAGLLSTLHAETDDWAPPTG